MWKPQYGQCIKCKPGETRLLVVKAMLCKFHNEELKKTIKPHKLKAVIKSLNETMPRLIKKLDTIFSIYIRLREADAAGFVKCFTCPKIDNWKKLQCGHYVTRANMTLRYDIFNCHPQCVQCNILKKGNMDAYAINLKKTYGDSVLDLLDIRKNNRSLLGRFELELLIKDYTEKVEALKRNIKA